MSASLDHLVVAAPTLAEGARWCEAVLGIAPGPGGKHPLMGTHNRLFSIASAAFPQAYFEIIAIDPDAPPPARARWFGMDAIGRDAAPRLVHWVARSPSLDAQCATLRALSLDPGKPVAAFRETPNGRLDWRISVRDDGLPLCGGALPTLIEWGPVHPTASMAPSGVRLQALALRGLPEAARQALDLVGVSFESGERAAIRATLDTPRGPVTLHSA